MRKVLLILLNFGILCTLLVSTAQAAGAPNTGLEGGQRHSFGPGTENKSTRSIVGGAAVDAYGNPVVPLEENNEPRQRLRSGAYGGAREDANSRPLPDLPETDAGWNFN